MEIETCRQRIVWQRGRAIGLTLLLAAGQAAATQQAPAQVTGTVLVRDMLASPRDDPLNNFRRERAMGYIDGVMDAEVGKRWCPAGKKVPHEMNYLVAEEMSRLPATKLNGNAAALVVVALAHLFPCKPGAAR